MRAALLEFIRPLAGLEPFLPEVLLILLVLLAIAYVVTLRRIRFDLRLFSKALRDGLAMENGMPVLPQFCSRDVRKVSGNMNDILKRQAHRAHWMLEFLISAEARLHAQAETSASLGEAARTQKKHLEELREILDLHAKSLEKQPAPF